MNLTTTAQAELTSCQQSALDVLTREGNVFLTGAAGTGKSFLLDAYLRGKPSDAFPVVASTGAAAVLVGGRTFHSFFGLGILEGGLHATIARASKSRKLALRLRRACCVVIDEVSMLSGTTLMAAELIARRCRGIDAPWGGLRIIAVGDFAQLPPVTQGMQQKDWAFLHDTWRMSEFQPALLSTVMRTKDHHFLDVLNHVRAGRVNDEVRAFLDERTGMHLDHTDATRLYPHRAKADAYNLDRLDSIRGEAHAFETVYEGDERSVEAAKRAVPVPETLLLKEDALVMLRKNDFSEERLYVNGSLGHVRRIGEETLSIKLLDGATIDVPKMKFTCLNGDGQEIAAAWNFPVTLAWATTIHKAQGASLDSMIVDLQSLWEPGQAYVALSRVRSAKGLFIDRWSPASIKAEPLVTAFYDGLAQEMKSYVPRPLYEPALPEEEAKAPDEDSQEEPKPRKTGAVSARRAAAAKKIKAMVEDRMALDDIADACGMQPERVLIYLEKFALTGQALDISYMLGDVERLNDIRITFEEFGLDRLAPVYDALKQEVPYLTLRMVRCAMVAESA